ncbi:HD-GYP domain-containing protein [Uliginosibacterium gangwonense]|uniref:HD-GYP domain-containing protein n=1 Tax=Uliginosibacterium gangwonense TaxID=392736 RepID=UPI00036951CF|nr:HD domain-containing phosphohydrolase [Uliginosibacterium gangwonense]
MTRDTIDPTNRHFLNALVKLSEEEEIEVAEDVYGQNGIKLVARGTRVSSKLYERVVNHKLLKPLEVSLSIAGEDALDYARVGEELLAEFPQLKALTAWQLGNLTPLRLLADLRFPSQAKTLLTLAARRNPSARRHDVLVTLLALGLAHVSHRKDAQWMDVVARASILHDIGELYIDPEIVKQHEHLAPMEWLQYSAHPVIGATLAREVLGMEELSQRGILEHHETLDGFGYPRAIQGAGLSTCGMILGVATFISSLILQEYPYRRIDIALKFIPGEFDTHLVNSISELLHGLLESQISDKAPTPTDPLPAKIHQTLLGMGTVLETYERLKTLHPHMSHQTKLTLDSGFNRFVRLQRAFTSTGVEKLSSLADAFSEVELGGYRFEARCVLHEIAWRCNKLAREIAANSMRDSTLALEDQNCLMEFSNALAGAS